MRGHLLKETGILPDYDAADYLRITLIMGLMGAFFWAIRGTRGFGGESGGTLAGLGWASLWLAFSHLRGDGARRPYGSAWMLAAIVLGVAAGGLTGYGVYISWLNGVYQMNGNEVARGIAPWTGYVMLFICGIHWGGVTGSFMAWAGPAKPVGWRVWVARILAGAGGGAFAAMLVGWFPSVFLPFYNEGYYQIDAYATSARAMRSATTIAQHVGPFLGFLSVELARRDWRAVKVMLVMAFGFAIPFAAGGYWHTLRGAGPDIDWWKNWEMTIGLGGGLAFGLAFYLFNRPTGPPRRPALRLERIVVVGPVLWLALGTVMLGAYDGFMRLHGLEASVALRRTTVFWIYQCAAGCAFAYWAYRAPDTAAAARRESDRPPLPVVALTAILAIVVLAGFAVSIPDPRRLADTVLLALYSLYVASSAMLFATIIVRRRASLTSPDGVS
ncbi:MAG: hypothetical protein ABI603_02040 [Acidobacteriota bacterium]